MVVELLFQASRLSAWGLGLMLVYVALSRVWNSWRWHFALRKVLTFKVPEPLIRYDPPRASKGNPTTLFGAILGLVPIFAFTPAIAAKRVAWLQLGALPWSALISVWLLVILLAFLLWKLAFRPVRKMALSAGWVALSHFLIWIEHVGL